MSCSWACADFLSNALMRRDVSLRSVKCSRAAKHMQYDLVWLPLLPRYAVNMNGILATIAQFAPATFLPRHRVDKADPLPLAIILRENAATTAARLFNPRPREFMCRMLTVRRFLLKVAAADERSAQKTSTKATTDGPTANSVAGGANTAISGE